MTIEELEIELRRREIPEDMYSLTGGLPNEGFGIYHFYETWRVYYSERGNRRLIKDFDNESDACLKMLEELSQYANGQIESE